MGLPSGEKGAGEAPDAGGRVVALGRAVHASEDVGAASHHHRAVIQASGAVVLPGVAQRAGEAPETGGGVVELRRLVEALGEDQVVVPCCHQHLAVGEQGGGVVRPVLQERAGGAPGAGTAGHQVDRPGVVELGGVEGGPVRASRHQHPAIGQQRGAVVSPGEGHGAGRAEGSGGGVVDLSRSGGDDVLAGYPFDETAGHQHLSVAQQGGGVALAGSDERARGGPAPRVSVGRI